MFCGKCGCEIGTDVLYCGNCGSRVQVNTVTDVQISAELPEQEVVYIDSPKSPLPKSNQNKAFPGSSEKPSMIWCTVLEVLLSIGGVINIITGLLYVTGSRYESEWEAEIAWYFVEGLQGFEIFCGMMYIILGILGIAAVVKLVGYKYSAPGFVYGTYVFSMFVSFCVTVGQSIVLSDWNVTPDMSGLIISVVVGLIMIGVNAAYFEKRRFLFKN